MKKSINLKIEEDTFAEMKSYATAKGSSLTGMVRNMVMEGFFDSLSGDLAEVKRLERTLEQADSLGLTNRDKADMELRLSQLKITNERFAEFFNDMAADMAATLAGGAEDNENA